MRLFKEKHGVSGYLDESFTAPDAILQALRSSAQVHKVLVGGTKTQASIDDKGFLHVLSQPETGGQGLRGYTIFANKGEKSFQYKASVSRYSKKLAIDMPEVRPPRLLKPGVNPALKAKLEEEIESMNNELRTSEKRQQELQSHVDELQRHATQVGARLKHAKEAQASVTKGHTKLTNARRKLRDLEEEAVSDNAGEKEKLLRKLQARMTSCVTALEAHADQQAQIMQLTFSTAGVRINQDVMAAAERKAR
jgi:exonuclease VII small subunit